MEGVGGRLQVPGLWQALAGDVDVAPMKGVNRHLQTEIRHQDGHAGSWVHGAPTGEREKQFHRHTRLRRNERLASERVATY
jgi:hypothetical protein